MGASVWCMLNGENAGCRGVGPQTLLSVSGLRLTRKLAAVRARPGTLRTTYQTWPTWMGLAGSGAGGGAGSGGEGGGGLGGGDDGSVQVPAEASGWSGLTAVKAIPSESSKPDTAHRVKLASPEYLWGRWRGGRVGEGRRVEKQGAGGDAVAGETRQAKQEAGGIQHVPLWGSSM